MEPPFYKVWIHPVNVSSFTDAVVCRHNSKLSNHMLIVYNVRDAARTIIESECWKDAMKWYSQGDKCYTPMDLLIENMPGLFMVVYM